MTDNNRRVFKFIALPILVIAAIYALSSGNKSGTGPVPTAAAETRTRADLDFIIKAKATAAGFGMTPQQYYAYETAADKAGITPEQWYSTMTLFTQRLSDLKQRDRSYLWHQLYAQGAGRFLDKISAGNTTTVQALEQSLDAIQTLKTKSSPSIAAQLSDQNPVLARLAPYLSVSDVDREMSRFAFLTDEFIANAKKNAMQ